MKSLIGMATIASLSLVVAACGGGGSAVEETCGALMESGAAAVKRGQAGKQVGTYRGLGTVETGGTYVSGTVTDYAERDDGTGIIGSVIGFDYTGELENGLPEGLGIGVYECDGDCRYVGEWNNGTKHGHGVMILNEACYVGEWVYDEPHGEGTRYDVHAFHGLGTTVGTFRHGGAHNAESYNDDELVTRWRDGTPELAEEYLASREARRASIENKTRAILDMVFENIE